MIIAIRRDSRNFNRPTTDRTYPEETSCNLYEYLTHFVLLQFDQEPILARRAADPVLCKKDGRAGDNHDAISII